MAMTATSAETEQRPFGGGDGTGVEEQRSQGQVGSDTQVAAQEGEQEASPQEEPTAPASTPDITALNARLTTLEGESRKWQGLADTRDKARMAAENDARLLRAQHSQILKKLEDEGIEITDVEKDAFELRAQRAAAEEERKAATTPKAITAAELDAFKDEERTWLVGLGKEVGIDLSTADIPAGEADPAAFLRRWSKALIAPLQLANTELRNQVEALNGTVRREEGRAPRPAGGRGGPDLTTISGITKALAGGQWGPNDDGVTYANPVSRDDYNQVWQAAREKAAAAV